MRATSALDLIGNTPLISLDRIHAGPGRLVAKAEFLQPGGSVKDRAAKAILLAARADGRLKPGMPVVEMTSGNMGAGLAVACAALGHPLLVTMSAGNSPARAPHAGRAGRRGDPGAAGRWRAQAPGGVTARTCRRRRTWPPRRTRPERSGRRPVRGGRVHLHGRGATPPARHRVAASSRWAGSAGRPAGLEGRHLIQGPATARCRHASLMDLSLAVTDEEAKAWRRTLAVGGTARRRVRRREAAAIGPAARGCGGGHGVVRYGPEVLSAGPAAPAFVYACAATSAPR